MRLTDLQGLIPEELGRALLRLAADVLADQAIVEVGSFKGKSTCYLATGAQAGEGAHVWAVDPWDLAGNVTGRFGFAEASTRETFERQVEEMRLREQITAIRGFSVDVAAAWDGPPIGLLYIDGDHSEVAVRHDFRAWEPHLAPGAIVAFDDLDTPRNPGVRVVVKELVEELGTCRVEAGRLAIGTYRCDG